MVLWYQSAQVPSPTPSLSGGGLTGPLEAVGFSPWPVEAGLLLWPGMEDFPPGTEVDEFPLWLVVEDFPPETEVDDFPLWLVVEDFPPWLEVDLFPPRSGVGWALSCHLSEARAA